MLNTFEIFTRTRTNKRRVRDNLLGGGKKVLHETRAVSSSTEALRMTYETMRIGVDSRLKCSLRDSH